MSESRRPPPPPASPVDPSAAPSMRRSDAPPPPPPHGYAHPESLAGPGRPPIWVWPSIGLGLIYPALARSARLDAELIERLPDPPTNLRRLPSFYQTALLAFVVVIAVFFSLFRGGGNITSWLGLGYDTVFTESYPFMLLALIIGMLSPSAGLLLLLLHMPFDTVASYLQTTDYYGQLSPLLPALAGRAVSWWLLWLLVVAIPLMVRSVPGATLASRQPRDPFIRLLLAYGAAGAISLILLWMWTAALPFLIRPVFAWTTLVVPTDQAVQPIQATGHVIIGAGVLLALGVTLLRQRFGVLDEEVHSINQPGGDVGQLDVDDDDNRPLIAEQVQTVGKIAMQAFAVLALGGIISGAVDAVVIFGASVIGQLAAGRLARVHAVATVLLRIPWVIRFIAAFLLTFVIGNVVNTIIFEPVGDSQFFPLVITAAIGLMIFRVLLGVTEPPTDNEETGEPEPASPSPAAIAIVGAFAAVAVGMLFMLSSPPPVRANNCSGWGDCPVTMEAVAAAGAGSAAVVAVSAALFAARASEVNQRRRNRDQAASVPEPPPDAPAAVVAAASGTEDDNRRHRTRRRKKTGDKEAEDKSVSFVERLRRRALRNYFGR